VLMSHWFDLTKKPNGGEVDPEPPRTTTGIVESLVNIPVEEVFPSPFARIALYSDPLGVGSDRFRHLRIYLRELWNSGCLKSLLITSPLPQDGKSTIALNLASVLAEGGKFRVLLIEADLHHPSLTKHLGLQTRRGLTDCLQSNVNPLSVVRRLSPLNWYLLSAGTSVESPGELLQTGAWSSLLQKLQSRFDWILIDSPPVMPVTDALILARQATATLLVAKADRTPQEALEKTIALLGKQRILGVVLNGVDGLERLYSQYGYYGYPKTASRSGDTALPSAIRSMLRRNSKLSILGPK